MKYSHGIFVKVFFVLFPTVKETTGETEQMLSRKTASKQFWEFGFNENLIDTDKSKTGALA